MVSALDTSEPEDVCRLFPDFVKICIARASHVDQPLLPEEQAYLDSRSFGPKREAEFRAGRACAREALLSFGLAGCPIVPMHTRHPAWPKRIVGSITHCDGLCLAAVAQDSQVLALGVDAEVWCVFPEDMASEICTPRELQFLRQSPEPQLTLAMLFSAKESVFKAVNPKTDVFFEFQAVSIDLDIRRGFFSARSRVAPQVDALVERISGRLTVARHHVLTSALIEQAQSC